MVPQEKVVAAAGGFTGLWAIGWLGAEAAVVSTAVQGGFAVGGVMASSGLALLWWRTRTMKALRPATDRAEESRAEEEGTPL